MGPLDVRILSVVAVVAMAGCLGPANQDLDAAPDNVTGAPQDWAATLPDKISGLEELATVEGVDGGAGFWLDGNTAYVGGQGSGFYIVDLGTMPQPTLLSRLDTYARDVDLLTYPDGRKVAALAAGTGITLVDVTDPTDPVEVSTAIPDTTVHNIAVAPGTHIIYNSRSLAAPGLDVVDASDPENPVLVSADPTFTVCHDVSFVAERDRAYCAAVTHTQIWDISDPKAPQIVGRIVNPAIQIHHSVTPIGDGSILAILDEFAGSTDAAAGCLVATDDPVRGGTLSDPVGAIWFYDTTDESMPRPLGYLAVPFPMNNPPPGACTAHFGREVPGHDMLVVGWRSAGTILVDYAQPSAPAIAAILPTDGDTWEARYHNGYAFAGDTGLGLRVMRFV